MDWDLPTAVEINGKEYNIRNKCDYRVVLDTMLAMEDEELPDLAKMGVASQIFYENAKDIPFEALAESFSQIAYIISCGEQSDSNAKQQEENVVNNNGIKMIYWENDFKFIAPAVSKVLGYSIRDKNNYTHWYDFKGALGLIDPNSYYSRILSIRDCLCKGKPVPDTDKKFYQQNKRDIIPQVHNAEDDEWLLGED